MKLRAALIQTDIVWADKERNLAKAAKMIRSLEETDIAFLPEMFTTGFMPRDNSAAETMEGASVSWMKRLAGETGTAIAGSLIIWDEPGGIPFNRFVFADPDGTVSHYDKRHLFSFSGEDSLYAAGAERTVWEYKGCRILPMVCYDLRFPVWSRNRGDYDVAVYVASWPASRAGAWDILLRARAVENQCYVLGVNRVGSDPSTSYCGRSVGINYYGEVMACMPDNKIGMVAAELDMGALAEFRNKFRAWEDADEFAVKI